MDNAPTMKAAIYRRYGTPEVVQLQEVPKPTPKDDEILIQVHATTVCATDAMVRRGAYLIFRIFLGIFKPRKPIVAGVEFSGRVVEVGKNVSRFKVDDFVFGWPGKGKGTHAEYICTSALGTLDLIPPNVNVDEAASIFGGGMTALVFLKKANIQPGQNVLIYGASGAVGTFAVQLAKHFGARVTGVCGPTNQDLVKSLGADAVIDYTKEDFSNAGPVYDVIVDTVGKSEFSRGMRVLKPGGTYVLIAGPFVPSLRRLWASITGRARILGPAAAATVKDLGPYVHSLKELIESGKLRPVVSKRYSFAQIREAHAHTDTGHKVGSVLVLIAESDRP